MSGQRHVQPALAALTARPEDESRVGEVGADSHTPHKRQALSQSRAMSRRAAEAAHTIVSQGESAGLNMGDKGDAVSPSVASPILLYYIINFE